LYEPPVKFLFTAKMSPTSHFWKDDFLKLDSVYSSGKDGDVVGLGLPFSTESEKESE
jgi:hypothetical protein